MSLLNTLFSYWAERKCFADDDADDRAENCSGDEIREPVNTQRDSDPDIECENN